MGLFGPRTQRAFFGITGAEDLIPTQTRFGGGVRAVGNQVVTDDRAMRHSVVWACLRLQAGLISTFPVDQYRDVLGIQTEYSPMPPILTDPGGTRVGMVDWLAMTQLDLGRAGNTVGLIVERNAMRTPYYPDGLPSRIELQPAAMCSYVKRRDKPAQWRIDGKFYDPRDVYHERANVVAGMDIGLPTVLYAALAIGEGLSMQKHGLDWFSTGGIPKARMRNLAKRLNANEIATAKQWYSDTINNGDVLVTGNDWEYDFIQAQQAGMEFIEGRKLAGADVCRYFDTPADLVDVQASSGGSITYANITQRNLQYLLYHLGPMVARREVALSRLLPRPRYVKLNTDALLRMDPQTRQEVMRSKIESWFLTNSEARELDNLPPLTAAQRAELTDIYGRPLAAARTLTPTQGPPTTTDTGTEQSGTNTDTAPAPAPAGA
jgi:HK97 family phage portal protein